MATSCNVCNEIAAKYKFELDANAMIAITQLKQYLHEHEITTFILLQESWNDIKKEYKPILPFGIVAAFEIELVIL